MARKRNASGKGPFYKRWWFWVLFLLVCVGAYKSQQPKNAAPEESSSVILADRSLPVVTAEPTPAPTPKPTPSPAPVPSEAPTDTPTPTETQRIHGVRADTIVYVSSSSLTIHSKHDCSGMKNYREMTIAEADAAGYEYCKRCW